VTADPLRSARIWISPEAPRGVVDAVLRAGGERVALADANAVVWYSRGALGPEEIRLARSWRRPEIEWVQVDSAGVEEWTDLGVVDAGRIWTSAAGAFAGTVAEHVVALLLASARRLHECARATEWRKPELEGRPLAGSTVGLVGAGAIGRETLRRLAPFGVRSLALTRHGAPVPGADRSLGPDGLDDLLRESDHVVLSAPLTPATRGLFGARELDLIGPQGSLVNVGRGALVDTGALVAALRAGRLGGAFLDVTEPEPLPAGHPLWSEPRALITPHVANMRAQLDAALAERVEQNVARFRAGEPLLGAIDPEGGY
jgi:D-3-phosphoglycerate dehydrogenase